MTPWEILGARGILVSAFFNEEGPIKIQVIFANEGVGIFVRLLEAGGL